MDDLVHNHNANNLMWLHKCSSVVVNQRNSNFIFSCFSLLSVSCSAPPDSFLTLDETFFPTLPFFCPFFFLKIVSLKICQPGLIHF